jgi:hypothetical protein
MADEDSPNTVTTILLTGLALLLLTPIATDLFEGKPLSTSHTIGFSILAAGAVFFAYFRYLAQSWKTMLVAKSVAVVRAALAPVARSGWAWFILVLLFWGYLTAGPLIDYYATQVASQTEARKSALSDHERAVYEGRLSKYQEEIVGANDVEMAYEQKNQKIISQSIK